MRVRRGTMIAAGAVLAALGTSQAADAQEWRLGTQVGRISWEGATQALSEQASIAAGVSRVGFREWFTVSAGTPLADGAYWLATGSGVRLAMDARAGLGLDLTTHAFLQRLPAEPVPPSAPPLPGLPGGVARERRHDMVAGGGGQSMVVGFARFSDVRAEARAGFAGAATYTNNIGRQDQVAVADGRVLLQFGPVQAGPEAQHWHRRGTYAGGTAVVTLKQVTAWGSGGQWTHGGPADLSWSAGAAVSLPRGLRLDASYRANGFDPLYGTRTGTSASLGMSVRLRGVTHAPPVPARYSAGTAEIRLRARDARAGSGPPHIAGDFTDWKPVPMRQERDAWVIAVPLQPGVYHYSFVTADGEWFVPENTPGRRSDGMGGHVAVLVVAA